MPLPLKGSGRRHSRTFAAVFTDKLLVDAGDLDLGRLGALDLDTVRDRKLDIMAITERQFQGLALDLRTITDTRDLEILTEPFGHTCRQVLDHRPRHAPLLASTFRTAARLDRDDVSILNQIDIIGRRE